MGTEHPRAPAGQGRVPLAWRGHSGAGGPSGGRLGSSLGIRRRDPAPSPAGMETPHPHVREPRGSSMESSWENSELKPRVLRGVSKNAKVLHCQALQW